MTPQEDEIWKALYKTCPRCNPNGEGSSQPPFNQWTPTYIAAHIPPSHKEFPGYLKDDYLCDYCHRVLLSIFVDPDEYVTVLEFEKALAKNLSEKLPCFSDKLVGKST